MKSLMKSKRAQTTSFGELVKVGLFMAVLVMIAPTLITAHIPTAVWIILAIVGLGWLMKK